MFMSSNFYILRVALLWTVILSLNNNFTAGLVCIPDALFQCGENEVCSQDSNLCECFVGFVREFGQCVFINGTVPLSVTPDLIFPTPKVITPSKPKGVNVHVWVLLSCLGVVLCSIAYLARRNMWLQRLNQLRRRRYDSFLVDNQGDDDDPPIV